MLAYAGARLQPALARVGGRGDQNRRRSIDHAGTIAGVMDMLDLQARIFALYEVAVGRAALVQGKVGDCWERRLQCREAFSRGLRTRELFPVQRHAAVQIQNGNQAAIEEAALDGTAGTLLAFERQGIDVGAADSLQRRDGVGAYTLV
jgi:hypothetical protein